MSNRTVKSASEWGQWHDDPENQNCSSCGLFKGRAIQAHHIISRGMGGGSRDDSDDNLVPLCAECHHLIHAGKNPKTVLDRLEE